MNFDFNLYSSCLLLVGSFNLFLTIFLFFFKGKTANWFSFFILSSAIWSLGYALELASLNLNQILYFIYFKYLGILFLPAIWLIFVLHFINKSVYLNTWRYLIIFSIPTILFLLIISNNFHGYFYQFIAIDNSENFPFLTSTPGAFYYINIAFCYFMLLLGIIFLVIFFIKNSSTYIKQGISLILITLIPLVVNFNYLVGNSFFYPIDPTPFFFIFSSIIAILSIIIFQFLRLNYVDSNTIINNLNYGLLVINKNNNIVFINLFAAKLLEINPNNFIGRGIFNLIGNEFTTEFSKSQKSNLSIPFVFDFNNRFYNLTSSKLNDNTILIINELEEHQSALTDIKLKNLELIKLNNLKDKLFSIIAHDLKSPFASLLSLFRIVNEDDFSNDDFKAFSPKISESLNYTSTMIDNLLSWSKSKIESINLVLEEVNLSPIIENEINYFSPKATEKNIFINNELSDFNKVLADKETLQIVFRNLISNAIKFCNEGGIISISFQVYKGKDTIVFKDTGIGMSKENVNRLFGTETFSTYGTKNEKGTGLGLLLCKDFIEKLGGEIFVESELGMGTTFFISFAKA